MTYRTITVCRYWVVRYQTKYTYIFYYKIYFFLSVPATVFSRKPLKNSFHIFKYLKFSFFLYKSGSCEATGDGGFDGGGGGRG